MHFRVFLQKISAKERKKKMKVAELLCWILSWAVSQSARYTDLGSAFHQVVSDGDGEVGACSELACFIVGCEAILDSQGTHK
ncbi:unnamed protein product [Caretta caretta]